ncbi:MAG: hydroxyisourate hydrolase [Pseudomonadota bacterium]
MATLSTHLLSSVDGTHAGGVAVSVVEIAADGSRKTLRDTTTDDGGRFVEEFDITNTSPETTYEMVVVSSAWFAKQDIPRPGQQIVTDIVIRFAMPDPDARYHIPIIIGPNGYSTWWSS